MQLDINRISTQIKKNIKEDIFSLLPLHLNIYDQAFVLKSEEKIEIPLNNKKANEIAVAFNIDGELKGSIVCILELGVRKLSQAEENYLYSLFIESMNIFLGQFLTNIENKYDLMSTLSTPKIYLMNDLLPSGLSYNPNFNVHSNSKLNLVARGIEFNCRLYIQANKSSNVTEV
jgi:hypothetical protein